MARRKKEDISQSLAKALSTKVTDSVKEEIRGVLDVNTDSMTATDAIAYAQVAKAIKGDKNAFEAISSVTKGEAEKEGGAFSVEIKVVD